MFVIKQSYNFITILESFPKIEKPIKRLAFSKKVFVFFPLITIQGFTVIYSR